MRLRYAGSLTRYPNTRTDSSTNLIIRFNNKIMQTRSSDIHTLQQGFFFYLRINLTGGSLSQARSASSNNPARLWIQHSHKLKQRSHQHPRLWSQSTSMPDGITARLVKVFTQSNAGLYQNPGSRRICPTIRVQKMADQVSFIKTSEWTVDP